MLISRAKVYKSFATVMSFQKTLTLCVGFDFGLAACIFCHMVCSYLSCCMSNSLFIVLGLMLHVNSVLGLH